MENYSYPPSYPDSGDSSPRSREIEFDNPPPWDDPQNPQSSLNCKVKFMCSYGGRILPRAHDNQLSYLGGETKILAVDRAVKFSSLVTKLSGLCESDGVAFKYQLPGEDLDALISVTNDDDLEHMMHEYDRLFRESPKPARLRLFLFPVIPNPLAPATVVGGKSFGSDETVKYENERLAEALNSGPIQTSLPPPAIAPPPPQAGNVDFLFGLEKGIAQPFMRQHQEPPPPVAAVKLSDPIVDQTLHDPETAAPPLDDRMIGTDSIQKHIQELQRLRIEDEQGMHRRTNEENLTGGYSVGGGGDYYVQRAPQVIAPGTMPAQTAGYWSEKQVPGGVFPASSFGTDQPVYMIPAPAGAYHGQMIRHMTGPNGQGYYTVQRMPEFYRELQPYNVAPQMGAPAQTVAATPPSLSHQPQAKISGAYSESYGMVRPANAGAVGVTETGYPQMAYDGAGRQVYYTGQGGMSVMGSPPPQQAQQQGQYQASTMAAAAGAAVAVTGDVKGLTQEAGKVVPKATQATV